MEEKIRIKLFSLCSPLIIMKDKTTSFGAILSSRLENLSKEWLSV